MKVRFMTIIFAVLLFYVPVLAAAGEDQARKDANPGQETHSVQEEMKKIVVRVNGVDITMGSVIRIMQQMGSNEKRPSTTAEEISALREEAIRRLVFQELVYQKAKADGMTTDPKTLDEAIANLKLKLGPEEAYKNLSRDRKNH